jgi:dolichyl-phosphate-mannose-protein mannosyltransferase
VLVAGFIVRVAIARDRYLVDDEALDYLLINQASVLEAYRASLMQAHPPLYYFLLYYWHFLGSSELMLRFPSVIAGTVMPWFAFLWLKRLGNATAFLALLLLTFSPAVIGFSTEVRPYAFLLLFLAAALWSLDRAFERNSAGEMLLFGGFLCLALFSQYSAIWAAIAVGIYALVRIFSGELKKSAIFGWIISQACALALLGFLWVTHISKLRGSWMEAAVVNGYLKSEYFRAGENVVAFIWRATVGAFVYLLAQRYAFSLIIGVIGFVISVFFFFGVALLTANRTGAMKSKPRSTRMLGVLMFLPVGAGCAGALMGLYPYGASRHVAYLEPFVMAAIAFGIAWLSKRAVWTGIAATVALLIACNVYAEPTEYMPAKDQARGQMAQAMKYLRETAPVGSVIVVDYNSSLVGRYYLCGGSGDAIRDYEADIGQFSCDGYEMARARAYDHLFSSDNFGAVFVGMAKRFRWKEGQAIWLLQVSEIPLDAPTLARFEAGPRKAFGGHICITQLRAP